MSDIIICTTALNRPELHSKNFPGICEFFKKLHDIYNLIWYINIDYIDKLKTSQEITQKNIEDIVSKSGLKIKLTFNFSIKPCFYTACNKISQTVFEYINEKHKKQKNNETIICWLEDDWGIGFKNFDIKEILKKYLVPTSYINLSGLRKKYIWALAPCFMGEKLFVNVFYNAWKGTSVNDIMDPEKKAGRTFISVYGRKRPVICYNILYESKVTHYLSDYRKEDKFVILNNNIKKDDINKLVHQSIISSDEKIIENQYVMIRIIPRVFNDIGRAYMSQIGIQKKWGDKTKGITYEMKS